jgi:hypothetical protein
LAVGSRTGSGSQRQLLAERTQGRGDGLDDDRVLLAILVRVRERRSVRTILVGIARARCRAGERVRADLAPCLGDEELGRRATIIPSEVGATNVYASGSTARSLAASSAGLRTRPASTRICRARTTFRSFARPDLLCGSAYGFLYAPAMARV